MRTILSMLLIIVVSNYPSKATDFPEIKGWKASSEVSKYNPENLWEYIDGAAELFLAYGFQFLHSCDLSLDNLSVTVDIYDMGTRLNAFGIYAAERPGERKAFTIGAEAVVSPPYQCLLLKDCYYVKVNVFEGQITETTGKTLLESIAKSLPGGDGFPEELQLLPPKGMVSGSEGFAREGHLGLTELRNCVYARYIGETGHEHQYFMVTPDPGESSESVWEKLTSKWKPMKYEGYSVLLRKIPYKGMVGIILTEKGILGVSDSANESEILKKLDGLMK